MFCLGKRYFSVIAVIVMCSSQAFAGQVKHNSSGFPFPFPTSFPTSFPGFPDGGSTGSSLPSLPGQWMQGTYQNSSGSRAYYLYVPRNRPFAQMPLVVALHGCTQDAPSFATQTGLGSIGEEHGFAVIFPQQDSSDNIQNCWNWFDASNQVRGSGELSIVVGMITQVSSQIAIDHTRVFVTGLSAGAAMTANLLACYSDIFAGGLINSGLEYAAATSTIDAYTAMSSGSNNSPASSGIAAARCTGAGAKLQNVIVLNGDQDSVVNPVNANQIVTQLTRMNDVLDDGSVNNSQNTNLISSSSLTAPGGDAYTMDYYGGVGGPHIVHVTVKGMGHAWSGAHVAAAYADPKGPDAGEMLWSFLGQPSGTAH